MSRKLFILLRDFESHCFRQIIPLAADDGCVYPGHKPGQEPLKGHEEVIPEEDDKDIN